MLTQSENLHFDVIEFFSSRHLQYKERENIDIKSITVGNVNNYEESQNRREAQNM